MTPSTRLSISTFMAAISSPRSSCVLSTIVSNPRSRDVSEMPRTTPAKNGLPMSATITPRVWLTPVDMLRASAFAR